MLLGFYFILSFHLNKNIEINYDYFIKCAIAHTVITYMIPYEINADTLI